MNVNNQFPVYRFFITAFLIIVASANIYGHKTPKQIQILTYNTSTSVPVGINSSSTVSMLPLPSLGVARHYNIKNIVSLMFNNNDPIAARNKTVYVSLDILYTDGFGNTQIINKTLQVSNGINEEKSSIDLNLNAYQFTTYVKQIYVNGSSQTTLPEYVSIESELYADRFYNFANYTETVAYITNIQSLPNNINNIIFGMHVLSGQNPPIVPEEYQLEWQYKNAYDINGQTVSYPNVQVDFKENTTRISTKENSYKIYNLYDKGYIAFRVRAIGRDILDTTKIIYGPWSIINSQPVFLDDLRQNDYIITNYNYGIKYPTDQFYSTISSALETKLNWQSQSTFAEDGKRKDIVTFFDGTLRERQMVTRNNADNTYIVGEKIYDYQGRPAIDIMPVPVNSATPKFQYYRNFNLNDANVPYSAADFDKDPISPPNQLAKPMAKSSGASWYYSENNTLSSTEMTPHAKKFPFSQIEYTPDNTGRIARQSGVGEPFQLGSGHETKFLYGQPDQIELDRLFGSEAGDASHYKVTATTDANGQQSATIYNQSGKAVVTSLSGPSPKTTGSSPVAILDPLDNISQNAQTLTVDLFNKNAYGNSAVNIKDLGKGEINFSKAILVKDEGTFYFTYNMSCDTLFESCLNSGICLKCAYDLDIKFTDENGKDLITEKYGTPIKTPIGNVSIGSGGQLIFSKDCNPGEIPGVDPAIYNYSKAFNFLLKPGVYYLSKTLKVNEQAKDFFVQTYIDNSGGTLPGGEKCIKTLTDFENEAKAAIDYSGCDLTCAQCTTNLGSKADFIASNKGTGLQWEKLLRECNRPCETPTLCDIGYEAMLMDMSPSGQYGQFDGINSAANFPLSIFNENNLLNANNVISGGSTIKNAHWHYPKIKINGTIYPHYYNENLERVKVTVVKTYTVAGSSPEVIDINKIYLDPTTGNDFTYPENLKNLDDFMDVWDNEFAKSLVSYHPEYAYYLSCTDHITAFESNSSDAFDKILSETKTFNDAKNANFVNATNFNQSGVASINKITNLLSATSTPHDPFFTNVNYIYNTSVNPNNPSTTAVPMAGSNSYNVNLFTEMNAVMQQYYTANGSTYSIVDMAAIITRCSKISALANINTCKAFGTDVSVIPNDPMNDTIRNREWRQFKKLYFAEKERLQFKRMNFYAKFINDPSSNVYGGCNTCFENISYSPITEGMIINGAQSALSPYYSTSQPCGSSTASNFIGAQKRFFEIDKQTIAAVANNLSQSVLQVTGQCPMAFQLEKLLKDLVISGSFTSTNPVDLTLFSSFTPDIHAQINNGVAFPINKFYWKVTNTTATIMNAIVVKSDLKTVVCDFTFDLTGSLATNFINITDVKFLKPSIGSNPKAFDLSLTFGGSNVDTEVKGTSSCMNIKDCNFAPTCVPNELATDLANLLSSIKSAGTLQNSGNQNLSTHISHKFFLTKKILSILTAPFNHNIIYTYNAPTNTYSLYDQSLPNVKLNLAFSITPNGAISSINSFTNIKSNYNNYFTMEGMNFGNVKIADINGEVILLRDGKTIKVSMGECSAPESFECLSKEHKVRKHLKNLVAEVLTQNFYGTFPIVINPSITNLNNYINYSSLLKSYVANPNNGYYWTLSTSPNGILYEFKDVTGATSCTFEMHTDPTSPLGSAYVGDLTNISNVIDVVGIGSPNADGTYNNFKILVERTIGANTVAADYLLGTSCWPIKNCEECPLIPNTPASGAGSPTTIAINSTTYNTYKNAVNFVKTKPFGVPSVIEMTYGDFETYGYENAVKYIDYANRFDSRIDNSSWILDPKLFLYEYGNLTNCNKEWERYKAAFNWYNSTHPSTPLNNSPSFQISEQAFYYYKLCDNIHSYIHLLLTEEIPPSIGNYFELDPKNLPVAESRCESEYQLYVDNHMAFYANPQYLSIDKKDYPLYSYQEIVEANLCCGESGSINLNNYISAITDATNNGSVPPPLPFLTECEGEPITHEKLCQRNYIVLSKKINDYDNSTCAISQVNFLNPLPYISYNSFKDANACSCIMDYFAYLKTSMSPCIKALNINSFCGISEPTACEKSYVDYLQVVNAYNGYILKYFSSTPSLYITNVVNKADFLQFYCACSGKFIAHIQAILNGNIVFNSTSAKPEIHQFCEQKCPIQNPPNYDNAIIDLQLNNLPIESEPCATQALNIALYNAANNYKLYINNIKKDIGLRYIKKCMSAIENLSKTFPDNTQHITLYYYDRAGNLIKTVPPEGVQILPITNTADALSQQIIEDRTRGSHSVFTNHRLASTYIYNSLNQLIAESTPDEDKFNFCESNPTSGLDPELIVNAVQFDAANAGYLCGYVKTNGGKKLGLMYRSTDGGFTWTRIEDIAKADFKKIQFIDANTGYAVANYGMVFKTSNAGNDWELLMGLYKPTSGTRYVDQLNDLHFRTITTTTPNTVFGLVGGINIAGNAPILFTNNGGLTFSRATVTGSVSGDEVTSITYDGARYYATIKNGNIGKMFTSTNGTSWTQDLNFSANNLKKVQYIDDNNAFAIGEEGTLLKLLIPLSNAAPTWQLLTTGVLGNFLDIYFKNPTDGIAIIEDLGAGKRDIFKTFDGGLSWQMLSNGFQKFNTFKLYDPAQQILMAAGDGGLMSQIFMSNKLFNIAPLLSFPSATNNYINLDAKLGSNGLNTITLDANTAKLYIASGADFAGANWKTVDLTSYTTVLTAGDKFVKVISAEVSSSYFAKAILLSNTGKLYYFYLSSFAATPVFTKILISGATNFIDITAKYNTDDVYTYESVTKGLYKIALNAASTAAPITSKITNAAAITPNVSSIDMHDALAPNTNVNKILMVGNTGSIFYCNNIATTPSITWTNLTLKVSPTRINKIIAVAATNVIAFGEDGTLWKNTSGATNWRLLNSRTVDNLVSAAINNSSGIGIVISNNKMFKLSNAQLTSPLLSTMAFSTSNNLTDVALQAYTSSPLSSATGLTGAAAYVTSDYGNVYYIDNYSSSSPTVQNALSFGSNQVLNTVAISSGANAVVMGNKARVGLYLETNGVETKNIFTNELISTHFYDFNNGFVIDNDYLIRKTSDAGLTWDVVIPSAASTKINKIAMYGPNEAILIGNSKYAATIKNKTLTDYNFAVNTTAGLLATTNFLDVSIANNNDYAVIVGTAGSTVSLNYNPSTNAYAFGSTQKGGTADLRTVHVFENAHFVAAGASPTIQYFKPGLGFKTHLTPAATGVIYKDIYADNFNCYVVGSLGTAYKSYVEEVKMDVRGITANGLVWTTFCDAAVYDNYTTTTQKQNIDFTSIAFTKRNNYMLAGSDANVTIGTNTPVGYSKLIREYNNNASKQFWYDQLGRLTISQNAKQYAKTSAPDGTATYRSYSYTVYDGLGRIEEVGEKYDNAASGAQTIKPVFSATVNGAYVPYFVNEVKYKDWLSNVAGPNYEVSRTTYSQKTLLTIAFQQDHLRNRVASSAYYFKGSNTTYDYATHYSYDVHGNVKTLWQDNSKTNASGAASIPSDQRIKQINYNYDLVSGKVNSVIYSPDKFDQIIHSYKYDAENRLKEVYTNSNGLHSDLDAKYFYYKHGPLARVEIGKNQVQGMDYAYTLQGWIKGVNSNTLWLQRDIGLDGNAGNTGCGGYIANSIPNTYFSSDAFGYTLNYYANDYEPINTQRWTVNQSCNMKFEADKMASNFSSTNFDLYNGNISSMVTTIAKVNLANGIPDYLIALPLGTTYRYDQLNRIKATNSYTNLDMNTNTWLNNGTSIANLYKNTFKYDANGNIIEQIKHNDLGVKDDELKYDYTKVSGKLKSNRLNFVDDLITTNTALTYDVKDQNAGNYTYDKIGNLERDNAEKISIKWNVMNKITEIIADVNSGKKSLKYDYDAGGNRAAKHVYNPTTTAAPNAVWNSSTYYIRDAQGQVMATYEHKNVVVNGSTVLSYKQIEAPIYGSSRLGVNKTNNEMIVMAGQGRGEETKLVRRKKMYELSNHLGNVLSIVSDKKLQVIGGSFYTSIPDIMSTTDYYPFGAPLPGRSFRYVMKKGPTFATNPNDVVLDFVSDKEPAANIASEEPGYRYGFNGKENDNEVKGQGNQVDFGERIHDPRLGRFLSIDPLAPKYPHYSPYLFAGNTPIQAIDKNGLEEFHYVLVKKDGKTIFVKSSTTDIYQRAQIVVHYNNKEYRFYPENDGAAAGYSDLGAFLHNPEQTWKDIEERRSEVLGRAFAATAVGMVLTNDLNSDNDEMVITTSSKMNSSKIDLSSPQGLLSRALKRQGLNRAPEQFKEKWSEEGYDFEVRIHKAQSNAPLGSNSETMTTYRVARRLQGTNEKGEGNGWEFADEKGNWFKQSDLKSGKNEAAANDTHIPLKR
jgi:RHS repeat-associated protein